MSRVLQPGVLWALFGAVMSACFVIPWKMATAYGEPALITLVLLVAAAVFNTAASFLPQLRVEHESERPLGPTLRLAMVFAALSLAGNWSSAEAVRHVSSALLSVLARCEVLVVGVLGIALLGERPGRAFWVGAAVAGAGLVLLQRPGAVAVAGAVPAGAFDPVGVLYGLGAAAAFGTMVVLTRRYVAQVRLVVLNALRLWLSVLMWFAVERRIPTAAELPPKLLLYATLAAFFGPFLSRLAVSFSARHVAASTTSVTSLSAPAITLLFSFLLLGTLPTSQELLGGAVLLAGVAIPLAASARHPR
jgi:drug/metabolite transporter (DMT)-like permease